MTTPSNDPEQLLAQTAWLERLSRQLVPRGQAADLAQDTLAAALQRPGPNHANLRTWLAGIARNLAAGGTRSRDRRLRRERHAARPESGPSTADTIAQFEMHRSVVDAVQSLREPMRSSLLLRFWDDLPPREISQRMQVPVETVRTRIKRGLAELRGALDAKHGRRDAWCLPVLSLVGGGSAATAPASLAVPAIGVCMQIKTVVLGAVAVLGLIGVFAWSASDPRQPEVVPGPDGTPVAAATDDQTGGLPALGRKSMGQDEAEVPGTREPVLPDSHVQKEWFIGSVTDDLSRPIAGVEVGVLTEAQADTYRRYDGPRPNPDALQLARTRWGLWGASERGWMLDEDILLKLFGVTDSSRTDADGVFRIPRNSGDRRTVLVLWSAKLSLRFQAINSPSHHQHIRCEPWPSIRGRVTTAKGASPERVGCSVDYGLPDRGRVLQFSTDAEGVFETCPIPPGKHLTIGFKLKNHHVGETQLELFEDATVVTELVPFSRVSLRLVDPEGLLLDGPGFAARGWEPQRLRFMLLREDFKNETELAPDVHPRSVLRFSPESGLVQGAVEDAEALVLSVWAGRERVTAARLPDHLIDEVSLIVPEPQTPMVLDVGVSLGMAVDSAFEVSLELGTRVGLGGYNFDVAATAKGAPGRFQVDVPGFLRGQMGHLIVIADGFAQQLVEVPIPLQGAPDPVRVNMQVAEFSLAGRVLGENNRPISDARVKLGTVEGQMFRTLRESFKKTDAAGEFRFAGLTDTEVLLFVEGRGFASASKRVKTSRTEPVIFRVQPGVYRPIDLGAVGDHGVMLRVLDAAGTPLRDDRLFGAVHGSVTRVRVTRDAQTLEVWKPGGVNPVMTIDLR